MANLLFDLYGVLLTTQSGEALRRVEKAVGGDESIWPIYWEFRPGYDAGELSDEEYWELVRKHADLEPFDVEKAVDADFEGWLHPDQEMIDYVVELTHEHKVGLLSNIPEELAKRVLERHKWLDTFESISMSYFIGVAKPEARAYEIALERLGAQAQETHFFDDNITNVEAAAEFGLKAHHFTGIQTVRDVIDSL